MKPRGQRPQLRKDHAAHATSRQTPDTKPPRGRPSRPSRRVRWPRFPHVALRPHPSKHGSETASTIRASAKKTFGAATGVSDPRLQKIQIQNNGAGGQAATVAGYAGPGFHTWPSGHILQNTDSKPLLRIQASAPCQKNRSAPRLGSTPPAAGEEKSQQWRRLDARVADALKRGSDESIRLRHWSAGAARHCVRMSVVHDPARVGAG